MTRRVVRAAMLAVVGAVIAGCGGDGPEGVDSERDDAVRVTTSAPAAANGETTVPRPGPPLLAVFGDSLTFSAWGEIETATRELGYELAGQGIPGHALCDHVSDIASIVATRPPEYVVVAFVGNHQTPCAQATDAAALVDGYEREAEVVALATRGSRLVVVGPPDMDGEGPASVSLLREAYARVAAAHPHAEFVDGRMLLSPAGYASRLPCLADETEAMGCAGGTIRVRDDDGIHLDAHGPDGYSAGARRWADTLLRDVAPAGQR